MKTTKIYKLFVYGTLKRLPKDTHYVRAKMWNVGQFPCIKLREAHEDRVTGQLLDVTELDLTRLDRYEGVPNLYTREKTIAHKVKGNSPGQEVFIYEWARGTDELKRIINWENS